MVWHGCEQIYEGAIERCLDHIGWCCGWVGVETINCYFDGNISEIRIGKDVIKYEKRYSLSPFNLTLVRRELPAIGNVSLWKIEDDETWQDIKSEGLSILENICDEISHKYSIVAPEHYDHVAYGRNL